MAETFRVVRTRAGYLGLVWTERGLRRVFMPVASREALIVAMRGQHPEAREDARGMSGLVADLVRYFEGEPVRFKVNFDWSGRTEFDIDVWRACMRIPYGKTASYKDLAERVFRPGGARAVGMAMSRNACPIVIPCHRVVRSDGSLGGFSGDGGVEQKQGLLEMESAALAAV